MSDRANLAAVQSTPAGVMWSVRERLDVLERDLVAARSALAEAETALLAFQRRSSVEQLALTTEQVAQLLGLSRST
ncbi:MAG: hypothetical protein ABR571_00710, partial [Jatrophihabitans sp.]|uniref:hypothetical protein n=1 Tax=Jatrophihabitans sp. TaxID=1932789 RepID=UPI00391422B0